MQISEQLKQLLAQVLPEGYDAELARVVHVAGQIQPITDMSDEDKQVVALAKEKGVTAGGPDPITDGRPTLMRMVAWMCHEGVNRNGDAFVREELPAAAAKVSPRHPLVMDWNHAAIVGGIGRVIGVWTKLDYAFDSKAKDGKGAWGILAEGVMFAWAYPEIADTMLAEQGRNGKVDFSMACIPSSLEFGEMDGQKHVAILHNPIFFTLSALDVAPGDKDAVGVVAEGDDRIEVEQELRQQLTGASVAVAENGTATLTTPSGESFEFQITGNLPWQQQEAVTATLKRTANMEVKLSFQVAKNAEGALVMVAVASDAEGKELARGEHIVAVEVDEALVEELATANTKNEELSTLLEASKLANAELEAKVAAAEQKTVEVETQLAESKTTLEAAQAKLAEIDAEKAEMARVAKLAERMAQLPEAYVAAHNKRDEAKRTELETEWSTMADEAWTAKLEDISLALPQAKTASYLERSRREGILPVASAPAEATTIAERVQKFTRSSR
jgi:hypothetical protein